MDATKHLLNRWSGKTNEWFPNTLFDASKLHGLDASAKSFRTENDRYIDAFLEHRWYALTRDVRPTRFSNLEPRSSPTFQTLGWILGFKNFMLVAIGLRNETFPVHVIVCTVYRERQACCASLDPCLGCLSTSPTAPK